MAKTEDCVYLVMELISGPSLRALLKAGPLDLPSTLSIGSQIADALAAAHAAGVVHGDVKITGVVTDAGGAGCLHRQFPDGGDPDVDGNGAEPAGFQGHPPRR